MLNSCKKITLLAAFAAAVAACDPVPRPPPLPAASFYYPTGMELVPLAGGGRALVVASSNFDLRYGASTVLSVDPDASTESHLAVLGRAQVGDFAGEIALLDASTCPAWTGPREVLVPSRANHELQRIAISDSGALSCGAGTTADGFAWCDETCSGPSCPVLLDPSVPDPYGVTVACAAAPGSPAARAFVTHLRTRDDAGVLSAVDLAGATSVLYGLGTGLAHSSVFDGATSRLFTTGGAGTAGTPLRWLDLSLPSPPVDSLNLYDIVRGDATRGGALSSDGAYLYLALVHPDSLVVLDVREDAFGNTPRRLVNQVSLPNGPSEVAVIPRPGQPDLVAVACTDGQALALYDAGTGRLVRVIGLTAQGWYMVGKKPFGLAVERRGPGTSYVYVSDFDSGQVSVVEVDDAQPEEAWVLKRFGPARR